MAVPLEEDEGKRVGMPCTKVGQMEEMGWGGPVGIARVGMPLTGIPVPCNPRDTGPMGEGFHEVPTGWPPEAA